jgi:hypothetical protein
MLWNRGEMLIKQVLEAIVIGVDCEGMCPYVRSPMSDCLDEPNELALICG